MRLVEQYGRALDVVLRHQPLTLFVAIATLGLTIALYIVIPKGFFPVQDTGMIQAIAEAPQNAFPSRAMAGLQRQLAEAILRDPAVENVSSFIGIDGENPTLNSGRFLINLKPRDEAAAHRRAKLFAACRKRFPGSLASRFTCSPFRILQSIPASAAPNIILSCRTLILMRSKSGCRSLLNGSGNCRS